MGLIFYAVIAACLFASGFGTAWKAEEWRHNAKDNAAIVAAQRAQAAAEVRANEIANNFERKLAKLHITNTTINRDVTHELETRIYTDCKLPDTGRVLLNSNIDAANAALGFSPAVPVNPPARKEPVDNGRSVPARPALDSAIRRLRDAAKGRPGSGGSGSPAPEADAGAASPWK